MNTNSLKNEKPPYLIGLLCILPLVGAFVGIALIFYGVFKYKDKWLIIIGSGGLIITFVAYFFLFYTLRFSKETANGFAEISQTELNSLVKNIEFYKIQKGSYPETLEQLASDDKSIPINDPLLLRKMNNDISTLFQYKKVGSGYSLFSVGIDGVPNTIDDIYPKLSRKDGERFGLIKISSDKN